MRSEPCSGTRSDTATGVVAVRPPEHGAPQRRLIGVDGGPCEGLAFECGVESLRGGVVHTPRGMPVKRNQPTLFGQVKALPWPQAPTLFTETGRGHGRTERRTVKVLTAPRIAFPHAAQVLRVHRWVKEVATGRVRRTYAYVITSLTAERADAARLAGLVRGHWRIKALHHARDVSFGEDASRVRTGHGPQNMAMLHNLVIPLLTELGHEHPRGGALGVLRGFQPPARPSQTRVTSADPNLTRL